MKDTSFKEEHKFDITKKLKELNIHLHQPSDGTLYKYVDLKTAKTILEGGMLLYQSPSKFNDPFDPHTGLLDFTKKVDNLCKEFPHLKRSDTETFVENAFNTVKNNIGILCLSLTNSSTLMWSHYADKHTGVCLGFQNIGFKPEENGSDAFKINYVSEFVPRQHTLDTTIDDRVNYFYWLCTKATQWKYEQEVRILNLINSGLKPFNKSELCEIYFGVATPQSEIDVIKQITYNQGYSFSKVGKTRIDKRKFDLEIEYLVNTTTTPR